MGYHEDLFRLYKFADPKGYRNLKKTSRRRDIFRTLFYNGMGRIEQMLEGIQDCEIRI